MHKTNTQIYLIWTNRKINKQDDSLMIVNWKALSRCMLSQRLSLNDLWQGSCPTPFVIGASNTPQVGFPPYMTTLSVFNTQNIIVTLWGKCGFSFLRDHLTFYYRRNINHSSSREATQNSKWHIGFHSSQNGSWVSQMLKLDGTNSICKAVPWKLKTNVN